MYIAFFYGMLVLRTSIYVLSLISNSGFFLPKDACKSDRSRQELSNEYLVAKIGFDAAENEQFNFHNFSSGCLQGFNFHRAVVSIVHP